MWHRACNTIHKTHKTYLADDLFTSKRIELKSYFYNFNTSNIISDAMIENVRENHKTLSRLATSDDIFLIRYEMEQWGDLYYHVLHRLGGGFQYDYLVKALAGALSVTVM
ncbi:TPA: hypothetical protein TT567_001129 [Streptococcus equi subsp. zooepidemicus]|nr:hypothetical protein [Streptococcus equi subsp. zooepidemicus]